MPLTAEDVKNKQFTPTRFKGGYDEKEVDDFLDEVEAELTRLVRENTDLRARLQVAEQAARQQPPDLGASGCGPAAGRFQRSAARRRAPAAASPGNGSAALRRLLAPAAVAPPAPVAALRRPAATGSQEAALRMLAMAQKTAEDTVADAKREADKVLGEARMHADQLERETQERHRNVVGNLDSERERLERKIEELRSFEREYRARLKSYLEGQLRDLDGRADGIQPTAPRPLPVPVGAGASGSPHERERRGARVATVRGHRLRDGAAGVHSAAAAAAVVRFGRHAVQFLGWRSRRVRRVRSRRCHRRRSPGRRSPGSSSPQSGGPGGPPRQATGGGFEVDEGPEVPPSNG